MFPDYDAPFCREVYDEASSYELLYQPVDQGDPDSPEEATMERLHYLAIEGSPKAVVELRKLIKRHPGCPTLKNYLGAAHKVRGEFKKARRVEEQLWREHPDYLFARIGKANNLLEDGRHEEARAILGDSLRLADTCPQTKAFHVSQWKSFYQSVGICYASAGRFEQAQAILNALSEEELAEAESAALQQGIMLARLKELAAPAPSKPPPNPPGMLESYQDLIDPPESSKPSTPEPDDLISQDYHSLFSPAKPALPGPSDLVGRNDPCPCGSGRKYKKCCLGK